jgi:hypothetical protein
MEVCQEKMLPFSPLQKFQGILFGFTKLCRGRAYTSSGRASQFAGLAISNLSHSQGSGRLSSFTNQ